MSNPAMGTVDSGETDARIEVIVPCAEEILPPGRDDFDDANILNLNLQTDGLTFQLQTRAPLAPQLVALTTRLEVVLDRLQETDGRLGQAIYRIGYLEAQLGEREREIERLQRAAKTP
jgi:hypothetical protein